MKRANIQTSRTLVTGLVQILAFADDIDIVGRTEASIREVYLTLKEATAKIRLVINEANPTS